MMLEDGKHKSITGICTTCALIEGKREFYTGKETTSMAKIQSSSTELRLS